MRSFEWNSTGELDGMVTVFPNDDVPVGVLICPPGWAWYSQSACQFHQGKRGAEAPRLGGITK